MGTFNANECVVCHGERDIPGFFCSNCAKGSTEVIPVTIKQKLVQEMMPGERYFVSKDAFFLGGGLLFVIGTFPISEKSRGENDVLLERIKSNGHFVVNMSSSEGETQLKHDWPDNFDYLWMAKAYYGINEDDDDSDEDFTIADMANGDRGFVNPSAFFAIEDGTIHVLTYYHVYENATIDDNIPVCRDEEGCVVFDANYLDPNKLPKSDFSLHPENSVEKAYFYEKD